MNAPNRDGPAWSVRVGYRRVRVAAQVTVDEAVGRAARARVAVVFLAGVIGSRVPLAVAVRAARMPALVDAHAQHVPGRLDLPLRRLGPALVIADMQCVRRLRARRADLLELLAVEHHRGEPDV